ncbi:MAG: riboflavin synthase [Kiritimatiellae bacterium]|nr:riboflavin synthase [Kiritimatiellia bacterium]
MFTGLVQTIGTFRFLRAAGGGRRLAVEIPDGAWQGKSLEGGESIAVNGACLTLADASRQQLQFDVSPETLARTAFASMLPGRRLNLERALRTGDALGGHFLSGHVDGVGKVVSVSAAGNFRKIAVAVPPERAGEVLPQGSIALDGVSLTVVSLEGNVCTLAVIPETWKRTALSELRAGSPVAVETDPIAKQVRAAAAKAAAPAVTLDTLRRAGFV